MFTHRMGRNHARLNLQAVKLKTNILRQIRITRYPLVLLLILPLITEAQTRTDAVDYSPKRGFYTDSFQLVLSTTTPGAVIRYTLDGSKPSSSNGQIYEHPFFLDANAMVRSYASAAGMEDSKVKTHSYIFPEQVIRQKDRMLEDYGHDYSRQETGKVFWTEEMDPEIVDAPQYREEIIQGLLNIPTLSVVMAKEDLWGENGIHWGDNLENRSDEFERECSVEMIYPDGYKGDVYKNWQENAGIRIQGGGGRWDKGTYDHKQSFTLMFKKVYGAGKLKNEIFADAPHGSATAPGNYDNIILRSGHNKGWGSDWDRDKSVYTRDQLGRDLQILMTGFGSHGTFVHLYLNGKYWGLYNPCERPDHHYLANRFGGESEDYFYAKGKEPDASNDRIGEPGQRSNRFFESTRKNYSSMTLQEMRNWVMVEESIASFLVYGYANPGDSPQYYYGNNNNPLGPVVWTPWDIEDSFDGGSRRTGPPSVGMMMDDYQSGDNGFEAFWTNIDFRMQFIDLVYKHFFNDGVMTDERVIAAWDRLTDYIYGAIICESARWGDERSSNPMDRNQEWDAARLAVRNDLVGRGNSFVTMLRNYGYFSRIPAPKYLDGETEIITDSVIVEPGTAITILRDGSLGHVYYTTDGSDPRNWDLTATISDDALSYQGALLNGPATLKARTRYGNTWSPLHELFVDPGDGQLNVTLIPEEPDNTGTGRTGVKDELVLYPNPVTDRLFLSGDKEYTVFSSHGILLYEGSGSEIQASSWDQGVYFIVIENVTYKILKIH